MKNSDKWNLDKLYKGFDEEFKRDAEGLKAAIEDLTSYSKIEFNSSENSVAKIETYLKKKIDLEYYTKTVKYVSLVLSADNENSEAIKYRAQLMQANSSLSVPETLFEKFLKDLNISDLVANSQFLKEHEFILNFSKESANHRLSEAEELVLSKIKMNAADSWSNLWRELTSTLDVELELDGEVKNIPLSLVRSLAKDSDSNVRKKALEAELAAYPKIEKSAAAALSAIKGEAITISNLRGYESVLNMTLKHSRMDSETLEALLSAMKEFLPMFQKYFTHKAKLLGHTNGKLPFYDLHAPVGNAEDMIFTREAAEKFIIENFMNFSEDLGSFVKNAFANEWVDWYPRKGKVGGAFCSNITSIKESRVLMNFNNSFDDVATLAHEFGHAYHGDSFKDSTPLNSTYSMPIAEVASTFCETIIFNAAFENATEDQKISILETNLLGSSQIIVDIYSRFLFEDEIIRRREKGALLTEELKELMIDVQKQTYGEALVDYHPYMWLNKTHYYNANLNYYNFPYAYGLLFAKGLYGIYKKEGASFTQKYKELLTATGKNDLYEVGKIVGINVHDIEFWREGLREIEQEIEAFTKLGL
ncbi:MAG: M3 family oligoendopeptidase [Defluviitaleaceae bacterium]|nr:M3 family oligoendopeptidase [Defluviitaleaceae bacterium]